MSEVDVLVIGAGPAGTLAAIAAARGGARVLLAERAAFPRQKVCGCCLSGEALATLASLGAGAAVADAMPIGAVLLAADGHEASITRRAGAAISRAWLDARLAAIAGEAGAEVRTSCPVARHADGTWDVGGTAVRARCAVVADGLSGHALDGVPGFGWRVSARSRMGFGALVPASAVRCGAGEIRMHVARGGYAGAVLLPCGQVDIAAAAVPAAVRDAGGPAAWAIAALGGAVREPDALRTAAWRGAPTLTRRRRRIAGPGIVVAGDAAAYVEPFTGEGMGWAMSTGAAAGALAAAVARGRASAADWPALHARISRAGRARCRAISLLLRSPLAVRTAIAVAAALPRTAETVAARVGMARRPHGAATVASKAPA
jgi:flavin-dependent dehydrogenase